MRTSTSVAVFCCGGSACGDAIGFLPVATGLMVITDLLVASCVTLAAEMFLWAPGNRRSVRRASSHAAANSRAVARPSCGQQRSRSLAPPPR